jgi:hypothetical protein
MATAPAPYDHAPQAVARALAAHDPVLAELLLAQHQRLLEDTPENRARVRQLLLSARPGGPRSRPQFSIVSEHLFGQNLTLLEDEDGAYAWLYDDDLVGLADGEPQGDPWAHNAAAAKRIRELFGSWRASLVRSLRLCLFGGTQGMAQVLREVGAAPLVSHLELRTQKTDETPVPIGAAFPSLRGLSCRADEVARLLSRGAPELRALIVRGGVWEPHVVDLAARLPKLGHLGLFHATTKEANLARLASHPVMDRITSLEIFSTNHASQFPFDALLERRDAFAYLQHIYLAAHLVPEDVRRRFEDWPEVELVTWDRRETMALDFQTTGWGAAAR